MTIRRRKVGNVVYLEKYRSYREEGKVKTEFVEYLGKEGDSPSKPVPPKHIIDKVNPSDSHRSGDVTLLWELAKDLEIPSIINRFCNGDSVNNNPMPGILLTIWAINRVLKPESATQLEKWVQTTDLPRIAGVSPDVLNKDAFLSALDMICSKDEETGSLIDIGQKIEGELYAAWRKKYPMPPDKTETLAYDLTSVLFFGVTCPLAEFGYNPNGLDQMQINVALLVTKEEHVPVLHSVYEGGRHGTATVKNFLARIMKNQSRGGTLIWDRGIVSKDNVQDVENTGWKLICGLPKSITSVRNSLDTEVPSNPETLVRWTKTVRIYAIETKIEIYGEKRRIIIYKNASRATKELDERNAALAEIAVKLSELEKTGSDWTEADLHKEINQILGNNKRYLNIRVKRKGSTKIEWSYKKSVLKAEELTDGKWVLLVTDPKISVTNAVKDYLEKDFIEKGFRTMKTEEELEPVRHRLENRVRAYIFVQVLALRLRSALRWLMESNDVDREENSWEAAENLLHYLGRVERMEISLGQEKRVWYLNLLKQTKVKLKKIGYEHLFQE